MSFIIQSLSLSFGWGTLDVNVLNDEVTAETLGAETSYGISIEQLQAGVADNLTVGNVPDLFTKILKDIRNLWE